MKARLLAVISALILFCAVPLTAHHSFAAEFDQTRPVTVKGTVTKVVWTNPHIWFYLDVKDPDTGRLTNWALEMGSPNALSDIGWSRESLKVGSIVTVSGFESKLSRAKANAVGVTLSDGKRLSAGSSVGIRGK